MSKMGRPKAVLPKVKTIGIRLTEDEYEKIKNYASEHNLTITKVLLKGMQLLLDTS